MEKKVILLPKLLLMVFISVALTVFVVVALFLRNKITTEVKTTINSNLPKSISETGLDIIETRLVNNTKEYLVQGKLSKPVYFQGELLFAEMTIDNDPHARIVKVFIGQKGTQQNFGVKTKENLTFSLTSVEGIANTLANKESIFFKLYFEQDLASTDTNYEFRKYLNQQTLEFINSLVEKTYPPKDNYVIAPTQLGVEVL